jgi:hypothetical protein
LSAVVATIVACATRCAGSSTIPAVVTLAAAGERNGRDQKRREVFGGHHFLSLACPLVLAIRVAFDGTVPDLRGKFSIGS